MSEWSKELDSKSSVLREGYLGFESLSLLHVSFFGEVSELAEGARLEIVCGSNATESSNLSLSAIFSCGREPYNAPREPRQVRKEATVPDRACVAVLPAFS